jgi:hypothetical protein
MKFTKAICLFTLENVLWKLISNTIFKDHMLISFSRNKPAKFVLLSASTILLINCGGADSPIQEVAIAVPPLTQINMLDVILKKHRHQKIIIPTLNLNSMPMKRLVISVI